MSLEIVHIPAFVATLLFLVSVAFTTSPAQAAASVTGVNNIFSSSDSGKTSCDLPPYSENLSISGSSGVSRLSELPPLDSTAPAKVATATFAMG